MENFIQKCIVLSETIKTSCNVSYIFLSVYKQHITYIHKCIYVHTCSSRSAIKNINTLPNSFKKTRSQIIKYEITKGVILRSIFFFSKKREFAFLKYQNYNKTNFVRISKKYYLEHSWL